MAFATSRDGAWTDEGREVLRRGWGWYVALGVALAVLGIFAIGAAGMTSLVSVLAFGWALIIGGVLTTVHAFWRRKWRGFLLDLAAGVLYFVVGLLAVTHPTRSALALTLLVAALLVGDGIFRIVAAAATRYPHWPWLVLSGIVSAALGGYIWSQWPLSGVWVLGTFVGVDLLLYGVSLVALGISARRGRAEVERPLPPDERTREVPLGAHPAR